MRWLKDYIQGYRSPGPQEKRSYGSSAWQDEDEDEDARNTAWKWTPSGMPCSGTTGRRSIDTLTMWRSARRSRTSLDHHTQASTTGTLTVCKAGKTTLINRTYIMIKHLGSGTSGSVRLALNLKTRKLVAIKAVRKSWPGSVLDPSLLASIRSLRHASQLNDPGGAPLPSPFMPAAGLVVDCPPPGHASCAPTPGSSSGPLLSPSCSSNSLCSAASTYTQSTGSNASSATSDHQSQRQRRPIGKLGRCWSHLSSRGTKAAVSTMASPGTSGTSAWRAADVVREIAILKRLSHPNIVQLAEVIDDPSSSELLLVMSYVEGPTMQMPAVRPGAWERLPEEVAWQAMRDVLAGLSYLHYHGCTHGDLKPSNLMRDSLTGTVKIVDFGSAVLHPGRFAEGGLRGHSWNCTPAFRSPESLQAGYSPCPSLDMWAAGVCMWAWLYGELPFKGNLPAIIYHSIQHDMPCPPADAPAVSAEARHLLQGLLQRDPQRRLSADEALDHLWITAPAWASARGGRCSSKRLKASASVEDDPREDLDRSVDLWVHLDGHKGMKPVDAQAHEPAMKRSSIRRSLTEAELADAISFCPDLAAAAAHRLDHLFEELSFPARSTLIRAGDPLDHVYLILSGEVELYDPGDGSTGMRMPGAPGYKPLVMGLELSLDEEEDLLGEEDYMWGPQGQEFAVKDNDKEGLESELASASSTGYTAAAPPRSACQPFERLPTSLLHGPNAGSTGASGAAFLLSTPGLVLATKGPGDSLGCGALVSSFMASPDGPARTTPSFRASPSTRAPPNSAAECDTSSEIMTAMHMHLHQLEHAQGCRPTLLGSMGCSAPQAVCSPPLAAPRTLPGLGFASSPGYTMASVSETAAQGGSPVWTVHVRTRGEVRMARAPVSELQRLAELHPAVEPLLRQMSHQQDTDMAIAEAIRSLRVVGEAAKRKAASTALAGARRNI